ncbi:hypothetical protein [Ferrovibrio sp.]|uniref:hypothetical protein n=1 Tax=Ferrovibrio sp. TaxID=1917215 RepID=UPI0026328D20|nr:hypothetical protein [Ferrovibrio sp.]
MNRQKDLFIVDMTTVTKGGSEKPIRRIVESALDFLDRAAKEIKTHPKYSIINFATAIELMFKARLMKEHWTLVVEHPSKAIQKDFYEGKSRTISTDEAILRLRNVCGENVPDDAKLIFKAISENRNRVIHFFHEAVTKRAKPSQIEAVIKEQCLGWYHLERLLRSWGKPFSKYDAEITAIDKLMRQNWQYLKAIYDTELPKIIEDQKKGIVFADCGGCQFKASEVSNLTDMILDHKCRVCGLGQRYLEFKCPEDDCGGTIRMEADHGTKGVCEKCDHELDQGEIGEALDTEMVDHGMMPDAKNCAFCMGYHSVVQHHDYFVCTECLSVESDISLCDWCNEYQIGGGDLEHSHYTGCEFCDGKAGWDKD